MTKSRKDANNVLKTENKMEDETERKDKNCIK